MSTQLKQETMTAVAKIVPAGAGAAWYSFTLNEVVAIATLCYIVLQIGLLIPKYIAIIKGRYKKE